MYAALWRLLPGRTAVKVVQAVVLLVIVVAVCLLWVFPWISPYLPFNNTTVGGALGAVTGGGELG